MDILKKNSTSNPPVLLSIGSRNNSLLNKIKNPNITSNSNILNVFKNKCKSINNKNMNIKNKYQTASTSINKQIDPNNKQQLSNKLLSRVFSYRKINKSKNTNTNANVDINILKISKKNINQIQEAIKQNKEKDNYIDSQSNNNNVTNNITNNITNIFINDKNKNKKNNNNKSKMNSIPNKNKSLTKRNSLNNSKFNSNLVKNFNTNNYNNNAIIRKNILNNLNASTNIINNTITNHNININIIKSPVANANCRIKYNKKMKNNIEIENINSNKVNTNINNINSQDFFKKICSNNKNKKGNYLNTSKNNDKKSKDKYTSSIKHIEDINDNQKYLSCFKRNHTEENNDENTINMKKEKNLFYNQIYSRHMTDYNTNNLITKKLLLIEPNHDCFINSQSKTKTNVNSMNYLGKNNKDIINKNKANNCLSINIQNDNKCNSKSKSKENNRNTIINFFRNKSKNINSLPRAFNNTNKNLPTNNIFNNYFIDTSRISSIKNSNSSKNNITNNNSLKIIGEYVHKPKSKTKSNNILINNISLNSINHYFKKDCCYIGSNTNITNNKTKNKNIRNNIFFDPFYKSKKYAFNYSSKKKDMKEKENNITLKDYYKNQTKIYDKKNIKNKKNNRCNNQNVNSDFNLEKKNISNIKKKNNNNINEIKNSKSLKINIFGVKKEQFKNNKNIHFNCNKNSNKRKSNSNNLVSINHIIQVFKRQMKHNIVSKEHIVKSERISPMKKGIITNNKNSNNISKELSKNKVENNKTTNEKKIEQISSLLSQDSQSNQNEKQNKSINSKNNNNKKEKNDIDNIIKYLEIDISDNKHKSFNDGNLSSDGSIKSKISKMEIKSGNKKICSLDSIESMKESKSKKSEDSTEKKNNKEKDGQKEEKEKKIINIDIPIEIKRKDPQYLNEYIEDILESLLIDENKNLKNEYIIPHYLENSNSKLTPEMRTVAVDWLVLIHQKVFKFKENTLFLSVQLFDRYLSYNPLTVEKTELLLLSAFALASKHEEVEYINMKETLQLAQDKFTKEEIIKMEYDILRQIDFEILAPTMCDYFKIFAFLINLNNDKLFQGFYILNVILVDFHMLKYPNCVLALAVTKLINKKINIELVGIVNKIIKKHQLEYIKKYANIRKINSICNKIKLLYDTFLETKYKNIPEKFAESKYNCVSIKTSI